jgi:hypothetical protein
MVSAPFERYDEGGAATDPNSTPAASSRGVAAQVETQLKKQKLRNQVIAL